MDHLFVEISVFTNDVQFGQTQRELGPRIARKMFSIFYFRCYDGSFAGPVLYLFIWLYDFYFTTLVSLDFFKIQAKLVHRRGVIATNYKYPKYLITTTTSTSTSTTTMH